MTTCRKPDLTDLWESMKRERPQKDGAINTLCYVQTTGPALTLFTNQPVDVAELIARMADRNTAART